MRPEPKIDRIFYTFREAQDFLNISHETLYKLIEQGLPSHKIGGKLRSAKEGLFINPTPSVSLSFKGEGKA